MIGFHILEVLIRHVSIGKTICWLVYSLLKQLLRWWNSWRSTWRGFPFTIGTTRTTRTTRRRTYRATWPTKTSRRETVGTSRTTKTTTRKPTRTSRRRTTRTSRRMNARTSRISKTTKMWKLNPRYRIITLTKLLIKHAKFTPKETEIGA